MKTTKERADKAFGYVDEAFKMADKAFKEASRISASESHYRASDGMCWAPGEPIVIPLTRKNRWKLFKLAFSPAKTVRMR